MNRIGSFKKPLSIVVTLAMVLTLMPVFTMAAMAMPAGTPGESESNPATTLVELEAALAVATSGDAVFVGGALSCSSSIVIPSGVSVTIMSVASIVITAGGEITNNGYLINKGVFGNSADFYNIGTFDNNGTIVNEGVIDNQGTINNFGIITGLGTITGTELVSDVVCEIVHADTTTTPYASLLHALAAVKSGETIRLLADIEYGAGIVIHNESFTIDVNGKTLNVKNSSGHGLDVGSGGELWLIDSGSGGALNVSGGGSSAHGVFAHDGGKAEVTNATTAGTGTGCRGANAIGAGTVITVYGDVTFGGFYGLGAAEGATLTVHGNVSGGGGMSVSGEGTTVVVYGNSVGGGTGIFATNGVTVYVGGNVIGGGAGVYASSGSLITIDGYVKATSGEFVYIQLGGSGGLSLMQEDFEPVSSKDGYFEYNDEISYVWVKDFNPPLPFLYSVVFEPGAHGAFTAVTHKNLMEGAMTPEAPEALGESGWVFAGWAPELSETVTGNATYVAQWVEEEPEEPINPEEPVDPEDPEDPVEPEDPEEPIEPEEPEEPVEPETPLVPEEPEKETLPQTGDSSLLLYVSALLGLSAAFMVFALRFWVRSRNGQRS